MERDDDIEDKIIQELEKNESITDTLVWCQENNEDHQTVVGVVSSLVASEFVVTQKIENTIKTLTEEGHYVLEKGTPEFRIFDLLPTEGLKKDLLEEKVGADVVKIGFGKAIANKWIRFDKATNTIFKQDVSSISDSTRILLRDLVDKKTITTKQENELKKRKLLQTNKLASFKVTKGKNFKTEGRVKPKTDLTAQMLQDGSWEDSTFKTYNLNAEGISPSGGYLHPLMQVRSAYREIFLEMGFQEMKTNNYVESSFWNFDALFQPQQHPARDAHDTFFLKEPSSTLSLPEDYVKRVDHIHTNGGNGSIGWRYNWERKEANKNILRTHTTAVSSRTLYNLANQEGGFKPTKCFSIDRVFRNESLDATHLAEFHQIEGFVVDYDLSLADLIGIINQFFQKIGITNIKFKPAYNPYTEPSMEIFGYLKNGKLVEIGNSGIFRPEMLEPMGLPPNVSVIAWGLSLERPTMIKYGIQNIRSIFGHKIDLKGVKQHPVCMY